MRISSLTGLGQALRWLRDRQGKKQYQVAAAAGITKGMLSAYETGRQRPSLETLEKLLDTLERNLSDLHAAIQIVNGQPPEPRPARDRSWEPYGAGSPLASELRETPEEGNETSATAGGGSPGSRELYRILDRREPLPAAEEQALGLMLDGFHRLIRHLHNLTPKS
ncbi:MAG TPA: helix-turn-helix transcriptional regulator [Thermoanaerobaculia bacterium]